MISTLAHLAAVPLLAALPASGAPAVGVGMGTDYACLPIVAQPGQSYSFPRSNVTVQDTGSGAETIVMSVTSLTSGPGARLEQVPASWVTFGTPQVSLSPGQMTTVPTTLNVPAGARPGPYESAVNGIAGTTAASGQGGTVTPNAGAATRIVFTVGPSATPPPPCDALDLAQASGKFPPWPTAAFATTGWKQVFARQRSRPNGPPTASPAAPGGTGSQVEAPAVASGPAPATSGGRSPNAGYVLMAGLALAVVGWRKLARR